VEQNKEDTDGDGEMCGAVVGVHELYEPFRWKEPLLGGFLVIQPNGTLEADNPHGISKGIQWNVVATDANRTEAVAGEGIDEIERPHDEDLFPPPGAVLTDLVWRRGGSGIGHGGHYLRSAGLAPHAVSRIEKVSLIDLSLEFDSSVLSRVLAKGRSTGAGFSEVFIEDKRSMGASLDDGLVEQVSSGRDSGAGIRVINGETTGFAYTADLSEAGLLAAAGAAAAAASSGDGGTHTVSLGTAKRHPVNTVRIAPQSVPKARKVELLMIANDAARGIDSSIVQVSAGYSDATRRILIANSDGVFATDEQVRTIFRVSAVANGDAGMQTGYDSLGHTIGFELFEEENIAELAERAARQAVTKLRARPAPSGALQVVIKCGSGGVLFHEACGHGLEADLVARGASVYANRVGDQVASPLVTLVDDGTMSREWGAIGIDDEGHESQRNVLIKDGVLTDYMWDHIRAGKEGRAPSGNGRRQSYEHLPMVRMTNTFVLNGNDEPDDIVRATEYGVYVAKLGGGQVNTASGDFVFGMTEAYLIENGQITEPLRESNLIGNGPQVLADIDMLGNDFAMGNPGMCGKDGQGVPVGDGQPTLRVKSLTIGGTAA